MKAFNIAALIFLVYSIQVTQTAQEYVNPRPDILDMEIRKHYRDLFGQQYPRPYFFIKSDHLSDVDPGEKFFDELMSRYQPKNFKDLKNLEEFKSSRPLIQEYLTFRYWLINKEDEDLQEIIMKNVAFILRAQRMTW